MRQQILALALCGLPFGIAGCDLDTTNPNAPTQETIFTTPEGLISLGVGLQARLGTSTANFIYGAGLVTDELGAIGTALSTVSDAEQGNVAPNAGFVGEIWNSSYRTIKTANDILFNHEAVSLRRGTRSALVGMAYLIKAAAIGEIAQSFKELPLDTYFVPAPGTGIKTPVFVDRQTALTFALALLDSAALAYNDTIPSAEFASLVLAPGLNIPSTIPAYRARFRRILNDWPGALAAADSVSRTVFSVLPFSSLNRSVIFTNSTGSSGVLPVDAFRLSDPTDSLRTRYHVTAATIVGRIQTPLDNYARYGADTASIPLYYPDEILLIKAEALVNLGRLVEARAVVDSVRTDCPGAGRVTADPGPCQSPYLGPLTATDLLTEIYRNRRYELFATGLRWEDARRLQSVGAPNGIAQRCWLPYPISERNANPANVPPDPEGTEPPAFPAPCP
ncbi:MAG: RagB/SusD family nutrient uptake outer membrane protein [Gemmatimonadaceae bacterium]